MEGLQVIVKIYLFLFPKSDYVLANSEMKCQSTSLWVSSIQWVKHCDPDREYKDIGRIFNSVCCPIETVHVSVF